MLSDEELAKKWRKQLAPKQSGKLSEIPPIGQGLDEEGISHSDNKFCLKLDGEISFKLYMQNIWSVWRIVSGC